jgi:hypothetical protein
MSDKKDMSMEQWLKKVGKDEKKRVFEPISVFANEAEILKILLFKYFSCLPFLVDGELKLVFVDCSLCTHRPEPGKRCKHDGSDEDCISAYSPRDSDVLESHPWLLELIHGGRIEYLERQKSNLRKKGKTI